MKKNFKKILSLVMCLLLIGSAFSVVSFAAEEKNVLTYALTEFKTTAQVVSCDKNTKGVVEVKDSVEIGGRTYKVTGIADDAFLGCTAVTKITIPEGVTVIGSRAFKDCEALKTVDIPKSLVTCAYDAFDGCEDVTVNCYTTNYQFFTVSGFSGNINVNILDKTISDEEETKAKDFFTLLREFILKILSFFGVKIKK